MVFRKSSIDRVSSPEQLNDYVRVSNPGVWMILSAVVVLLAGVCVWGIFGRLESKIATAGTCQNGVFTCFVTEEQIERVTAASDLPEGTYKAEIVTESVSPMSFILN